MERGKKERTGRKTEEGWEENGKKAKKKVKGWKERQGIGKRLGLNSISHISIFRAWHWHLYVVCTYHIVNHFAGFRVKFC